MRAPCEAVSRRLIPRIKSLLVNILYHEYRLTQLQISQLLGVSQSSVSRYLNEQRGTWTGADRPEVLEWLRDAARKLVEGGVDKNAVLCEICRTIRSSRPEILKVAA
ncbi:MAG: winged helix-turn-helix transcriptional regulator [Thermofilum sp.]|uniref:Winged helix-turn-helix transcriptional regulator n=1 Tax=Thermofilum pendens TaxID=2269 RepID=A0A7C4H8K6_THEPE